MGLKHFYEPTPKRMRKIGDTMLLGSTMLSGYVLALPISENKKPWIVFSLQALGMIGKMLMNLFKEDKPTVEPNQD